MSGLIRREACPACGEARHRTLVDIPYDQPPMDEYLQRYYEGRAKPEQVAGSRFTLEKCSDCGAVWQREAPGPALLQTVYDEWLPAVERDRQRALYKLHDYRYLASELDFLLQYLGKEPRHTHVLDFGFGWAEWARMAGAFGCEVSGCELSVERIAHARSIGITVIPWDDIPGGNFDFINTEQVFEHLVDPLPTLTHLASGLAPGGLLKVSVPNASDIDEGLRHLKTQGPWQWQPLMPIQPVEHLNGFTANSLARLGERAGLRVVSPGVRRLWNATAGWFSPRSMLRNLTRPFYRHVWPKSTYTFFTRA
jgi:SAM-dependent methyltransferase